MMSTEPTKVTQQGRGRIRRPITSRLMGILVVLLAVIGSYLAAGR